MDQNSKKTFCFTARNLAIGMVLACSLSAGCGDGRPQRVPVAGRVLIDGRPLELGFVQVMPANDRTAIGAIGPGGRFTLTTFEDNDGCVPGTHRVSVIANKTINPSTMKWFAPKKYMSAETSGLTIDVSGPRDDVEIKLSWEGRKPFIETFQGEMGK